MHEGVWVVYRVGMHTGYHDNDFYAAYLAVFLTKEDAEKYIAVNKVSAVKVLYLPFGRMLRRAFEAADMTKPRYIFPVAETSNGEVWFVSRTGRQFGERKELLNVVFFPSKASAEEYEKTNPLLRSDIRKVRLGYNYIV